MAQPDKRTLAELLAEQDAGTLDTAKLTQPQLLALLGATTADRDKARADLKAATTTAPTGTITVKVSKFRAPGIVDGKMDKGSAGGGISIYGMGRYPVTLFVEHLLQILDAESQLRAWIMELDAAGRLSRKNAPPRVQTTATDQPSITLGKPSAPVQTPAPVVADAMAPRLVAK